MISILSYVVSSLVAAIIIKAWITKGTFEVLRLLTVAMRHLPGVQELLNAFVRQEAAKTALLTTGSDKNVTRKTRVVLPDKGKV